MQTKKYCTIYVVRHGETEYNVAAKIQGQNDSPLTEKGKIQARSVGDQLKQVHFDAIFSSDLDRAQNTAEIIKLNRELVVNTTKLLRERAFGHYEGQLGEKFRVDNQKLLEKQQSLSESSKRDFKFYDAYESDTEIASRMITALREIAITYPGLTILVVSHGAIMRALLVHLGFGSYDELDYRVSRSLDNGAYIKLESDGVDFFIKETKGVNKIKL